MTCFLGLAQSSACHTDFRRVHSVSLEEITRNGVLILVLDGRLARSLIDVFPS